MTAPLARLEGISKRFGPIAALTDARLSVRAGEVHGVLGENGAGKSTLLSVLGGLLRPDVGRVEIDGVEVGLRSPRDAWAAGVGLVHQHFALVPRLTVLENLALGWRGDGPGWRYPLERLRREIESVSAGTGLHVPLEATVESLGIGVRQRVEILKALLRRPRIVVLDEPTAALTPDEVGTLFALLRRLAGEGRAVVLVAHKLDEVLGLADRVTVLRRGATVLEASRADVDAAVLTRAMVGEGGAERSAAAGVADGRRGAFGDAPVVARLTCVRVGGDGGHPALDDVSLEVRRGEIVGVAGVDGNGQRELAYVLAGRLAAHAGTVEIPGEIGFVPQDRTHEGLIGDFDLAENVALTLARLPAYAPGPTIRWGLMRQRAAELLRVFDVRATGTRVRAGALSGGNQQRLVVARELEVADDLLVAESPTRGLDVAATAFVHETLRDLARRPDGPGIVLISTDLDEVLDLADRILVVVRGRLEQVPEEDRSREGVGRLMVAAGRA